MKGSLHTRTAASQDGFISASIIVSGNEHIWEVPAEQRIERFYVLPGHIQRITA